MKLTDSKQAYTLLYSATTTGVAANRVTPSKAVDFLEKRFGNSKQQANAKKRPYVVVILDEMDRLITRTQTVLYNFVEWPTRKNSRLIVVGISNTHDLPDRLLPRVKSRLGKLLS
jgi:origin recognition complex subunit 1